MESWPVYIVKFFVLHNCYAWQAAAHGELDAAESWALLNSRSAESAQQPSASAPNCVAIPRNFSLCHGIDYGKMRLPNLLEHEALDEAVLQSQPWIPLLRLNCHTDTKLFLCSLFAPVCLERAIYPCRSLCETVKSGCEKRMQAYGFPWPEMLNCAKFPVTNDMCIQPRENYEKNKSCDSCSQVDTFENILDHFCRSDYVFKVKLSKVGHNFVEVKRGRAIKHKSGHGSTMNINGLRLKLSDQNRTCPCSAVSRPNLEKRFLAMANRTSRGEYVLNLILPWKKDKARAQRMFRKLDCKTLGTKIRDRARRERSRGQQTRRQNHGSSRGDAVAAANFSNASGAAAATHHKRRQHQNQQGRHRNKSKGDRSANKGLKIGGVQSGAETDRLMRNQLLL